MDSLPALLFSFDICLSSTWFVATASVKTMQALCGEKAKPFSLHTLMKHLSANSVYDINVTISHNPDNNQCWIFLYRYIEVWEFKKSNNNL